MPYKIALASAISAFLANAALAQESKWTVAPMDGGQVAARTQVTGNIILFAAACSRGTPGALLVMKNDLAGAKTKVDILADSGTSSLIVERTSQAHVYATILDQASIDILSKGTAAEFVVSGNVEGRLTLDGSKAALNNALGGCNTQVASVSSVPSSVRIPTLPAAAITNWRTYCPRNRDGFEPFRSGPGTHIGEFLNADLNGDGIADFAISTPEGLCDGQPSDSVAVYFLVSAGQSYRIFEGPSGRIGLLGAKLCGNRDVILTGDPANSSVWGASGGRIEFLGKQNDVSCVDRGAVTSFERKSTALTPTQEDPEVMLRVTVKLTPEAVVFLRPRAKNIVVKLCYGSGCDAEDGPFYGEERQALPISGGTVAFVQKPKPDPDSRSRTVSKDATYGVTVDAEGVNISNLDCFNFGQIRELRGQTIALTCSLPPK